MKKRKFKILGIVVFVFLMMFLINTATVNAAKVAFVGDEDDNDTHVVLYSNNDRDYYIEVDEETDYGYVIMTTSRGETILGTCKVIVYTDEKPNGYELCSIDNQYDDLGVLKITITDENTLEGYVNETSGSLEDFVLDNSRIVIEE